MDVIYQTFKSDIAQINLSNIQNRFMDGQRYWSSYPCTAATMGMYRICIHINLDVNHPKAIIYDINDYNYKFDLP